MFQNNLLLWYEKNHRKLPWRETRDPYKIWLSEIMLQQTQVVTVISYYNRFIETFPNVYALSQAAEETVFKLWEGLGYYSRAGRLIPCALEVVRRYDGIFPRDYKDLMTLPGIGPYTAGAVASIAYNEKVPAVDGNVMRVYSRYFGMYDDISNPKTKTVFFEKVMGTLPEDRRHFNQALMELGATVCTHKGYKCEVCPISKDCYASINFAQGELPVKIKKVKKSKKIMAMAYITCGNLFFSVRNDEKALLKGLWGFPSIEGSIEELKSFVESEYGLEVKICESLGEKKHVFTHQIWDMTLFHLEATSCISVDFPVNQWGDKEKLEKLPWSTAQKEAVDTDIEEAAMSKILVIAEKPSVGRDIARVLNCTKKMKSYIEGNKYIVSWALGHLLTLAAPEVYDTKYQHWILEDLPMMPDKMKTSIIPRTKHQFYAIKKLIERNDVKEIVIATDAGLGGELVARWILQGAQNKKPVKRLWISSVTDQAIRQGFDRLKPGKDYMGLYYAAVARAEADWILGINGTRAMTVKHNSPLSIGRVQTPTLNMIHEREKVIRNFKPKAFARIDGTWQGVTFKYSDRKGNGRLFDLKGAEKLVTSLTGKPLIIKSIEKKQKKSYSKGLYNLTDLQEDANRLYDYSAKQTLNFMQKLYESHKVLTYPRTDSRFLSEDIVPTLKERVMAVSFDEHKSVCSGILRGRISGNKSFVDNKRVTDHHAIIPTEQKPYLSDLSFDERRIYDLVVKRFLSVLMPPHIYDVVKVVGEVDGNQFSASFESTVDLGYRILYGDKASTSKVPNVKKGDSLSLDLKLSKGQTEPPSYFTEGMLVKAMEEPSAYIAIENKELKETLKNAGGIGTVATRGDIIDKLYNGQLIVQKGKHIYTTTKGKQLLSLAPAEMKSPVMTAKWEKTLKDIENGHGHSKSFIGDVKKYTQKVVSDIIGSDKTFKHDNMTSEKCPDCGKPLLRVENKHGKKLTCSDRSCGYSKKISQSTNARCPNCHKKMTLVGEGDHKKFVCKCGHRETMKAFNNRKNEAKHRGNSRDVNKYLNEMKKEQEPLNTALADALAKFKFNGDE